MINDELINTRINLLQREVRGLLALVPRDPRAEGPLSAVREALGEAIEYLDEAKLELMGDDYWMELINDALASRDEITIESALRTIRDRLGVDSSYYVYLYNRMGEV
jgi:hypothetical protein